jgi:hypothetical protein
LEKQSVKDKFAMKLEETQLIHQWIFRKGKKIDVWRNNEGKFVKISDETEESSK